MRDGRKILFVVVVLAMLCGIASAALAATSGPFGPTSAISYTLTDWTAALLFPKFNASLGTLTQVDMSITAAMQTTLTVTNLGNGDSHGNAQTHVVVTVADPGSLLSVVPDFYSPAYAYNLASGASITSGLLTKSGSDSNSWNSIAILNEFTGSGNITMHASTYTETVLANTGGNTVAGQVTLAGATGTVTYHYNLTPEPSSLLALSSLFGAGFFAIRRRR